MTASAPKRLTVQRPAWSWVRTVRYDVSNTMPTQTVVKAEGEDVDLVFDFSRVPAVVAGDAIISAELLGGTGLTLGTPTKSTTVLEGVAAGEAVVLNATGGTADETYPLAVRATLASGRKPIIPVRVAVTANY